MSRAFLTGLLARNRVGPAGHNLLLTSELSNPSSAGSAPATIGTYTDPQTGIVCAQITVPTGTGVPYSGANVTFSESVSLVNGTTYWLEVEASSPSHPDWYLHFQYYMQSANWSPGDAYGYSQYSAAGYAPQNQWNVLGCKGTSTSNGSARPVIYRQGTVLSTPLIIRVRRMSLKILATLGSSPHQTNAQNAVISNYRKTTGTAIYP